MSDRRRRSQPAVKYEVCPQCQGHGKMVDRAFSVWTESDRDEDPDGFQEMLAGTYDVPCDMCQGQRVVDKARRREFAEARADHFTQLRESGIGPGSPDWF